jgi:uncharacterized membrane protein (DUF106 family)
MLVSPEVDVALIAALIVAISQSLQVLLMNRKQQRANQKKSQELMRQHQELMKKGSSADQQEMERLQREQMELMGSQFKSMPKMLLGSMIIILPLFTFVREQYQTLTFKLFFPFSLIKPHVGWFWYYLLCSFIISIIVGQALNAFDSHHEKKRIAAEKNSTTTNAPHSPHQPQH